MRIRAFWPPTFSMEWPKPCGMYPTSPLFSVSWRQRPPEPNRVTLNVPVRIYCHSEALGCQCSSRSAPASILSTTPVMVVEIGNCEPSARHSMPPLKVSNGFCDKRLYLWVSGGGFEPCRGDEATAGSIFPLAK